MSRPSVAVLGASADRRKFGNKSVRAHRKSGYDVYPVNPKADVIEGLKSYRALAEIPVERLDRITVYLAPEIALKVLPEIIEKSADEVWFNPGSESDRLLARSRELGLNVIAGCSIVDLGLSPGQFLDS
jgi:hypothetical protein